MQWIAPLLVFGLNLLLFQNCSKIAATDLAAPEEKMEVVATASDNQGDPVPVAVEDATDMPVEVEDDSPTLTESPPPEDSSTDSEEDVTTCDERKRRVAQLSEACGLDMKTIHKAIDLAQFEGQDVNLDLLKGKVLVYSSDPGVQVNSLNIQTAVGRTILCNAKVNQLDVKKGRLEVYHSEILSVLGPLKNVIRDSSSTLPAGY